MVILVLPTFVINTLQVSSSELLYLLAVLELGAGVALPSLLASTLTNPPSVVTITDHPDQTIITNLRENVSRNRDHIAHNCQVFCIPYIWGDEPGPLLCVLQ